MTVQEAIQDALNRITFASQKADTDYPYDQVELFNVLPVAEIARTGFTVEFLDNDDADILPRLLVQSNKGQVEIERCPYAMLALISCYDSWDGAEITNILQQAGITTLRLSDFDAMPDWYGIPAVSWLFPQRLSEAFSLFDTLRESEKKE